MDSAWWYGNTMSLKGQHSREIADWADYAADLEDTAEAWKTEAKELDRELKKVGSSRDTYKIISDVLSKSYNKLKADHAAYVGKVNERWGLLADQWRVERAQKVFYETFFNNIIAYIPGLKEDLVRGDNGIMDDVRNAYADALRKNGITIEKLDRLVSNGYGGIIAPPPWFADPALAAPAEEREPANPTRKFVSSETIKLRGKVDELRTKYNGLVEKHNDLLDDRLRWAYRSGLNKAEAEGHKAVLELVRSSPREMDLDTPDPSIPAPEGHCDSPASAAFRRAYARHLLVENAGREELEQFSRETSFEFPFPVQVYMDWIAAQTQEDVPSEGHEGPRGP